MCDENSKTDEFAPCVIFPCSGAADVGAVADLAARRLALDGKGKMLCLAGVGGRIPSIMTAAQSASKILAIDGCGEECARMALGLAGFKACMHLNLEEMGMEKGKTSVTTDNIQRVAAKGKALMHLAMCPKN